MPQSLWASLASATLVSLILVACVSEDPGATPPPPPPTCDLYCAEVARTCGADKAQYRDTSECMKVCSLLDLGTALDGDVNSVGCRLRKARAATTLTDCVAAGPFGGGVCGTRCPTYCRLVANACFSLKRSPAPYSGSEGTCNEECTKLPVDPTEGEGPGQAAFAGKNTLNCRSHHLVLALTGPNDAEIHCPHATDVPSAQCNL